MTNGILPCRYATFGDKAAVFAGLVAAAIGGSLIPVFTIFLGELWNALGDPTSDLMEAVEK